LAVHLSIGSRFKVALLEMAPGQDEEGGVDGEKDGVIPEDAIPRDAGLEDLRPDANGTKLSALRLRAKGPT
jgi:hypothetical protein